MLFAKQNDPDFKARAALTLSSRVSTGPSDTSNFSICTPTNLNNYSTYSRRGSFDIMIGLKNLNDHI